MGVPLRAPRMRAELGSPHHQLVSHSTTGVRLCKRAIHAECAHRRPGSNTERTLQTPVSVAAMATAKLGPEHGRLLIKTGRSGLGRRAGHDLTIEATRWSGTIDLAGDAERVADATPDGSSVRVDVAVDSLTVCEGN